MTRDNKPLGTFDLTGIAPAPRGVPQVEVTFDIDANGIVHVSAKDRGTGKEQSMTISGGSALPKDEIERMVREAEQHADEDRQRREEAESRNQAEQLVYSTEKFLKDNEDKVPADSRTEVDEAITELKSTLARNAGADELKAGTEKLATASQKIGQAMYAAAAEAGEQDGAAPAGGSNGTAHGDDVVDAEVVDAEVSTTTPASAARAAARTRHEWGTRPARGRRERASRRPRQAAHRPGDGSAAPTGSIKWRSAPRGI
jgi:molecular chaperone DnaK